MSSFSAKKLCYSFPRRKKSCSIDCLRSCLQMICSDMTNEGKQLMGLHCLDLCQLYMNLNGGSMMPTFKAKESFKKPIWGLAVDSAKLLLKIL